MGKGKGLQLRMILAVTIPLTVMFISAAVILHMQLKEEVETLVDYRFIEKTNTVQHTIDELVEEHQVLVESLKGNREVVSVVTNKLDINKQDRRVDVLEMFDILEQQTGVTSTLFLANYQTGQVLSKDGVTDKNYNVTERVWYKGLQTADTYISPVFVDYDVKKEGISISSSIYDHTGAKVGAVGVIIYLDSLYDVLNTYQVDGRILSLCDEEGVIFYTGVETLKGKTEQEIIKDMTEDEVLQYNGEAYWYYDVKSTGLRGFYLVPEEEALNVIGEVVRLIIGVFTLIVLLTMGVVILMSGGIIKPIKKLTEVARQIAQGELDGVECNIETGDEIQQLSKDINEMLLQLKMYGSYIQELSDAMGCMAHGDLTYNLTLPYDGVFKGLKDAFEDTQNHLGEIIREVKLKSEQVHTAAIQVGDASHLLATSSVQQAGSAEEISAVMENIDKEVTRSNATIDNMYAEEILGISERATREKEGLRNLLSAVTVLMQHTGEVQKIIKTIEDISFQTKILSLNASIEAARAGDAGKGFAIVAKEIGTLAQSTEANIHFISETVTNIVTEINKVSKVSKDFEYSVDGVFSATQTLQINFEGVREGLTRIVESISKVTEELEESSTIVTSNSATSEETASLSSELKNLADTLNQTIDIFVVEK